MTPDAGGLRARAARYVGDALRGVRRAPVEVLATLTVAATFSWTLELFEEDFQHWAEVAVACVLVLAVAWTGTLLHAMGRWDARRRWAFTLAGAAAVAAYALTVASFEYEAEGWRAALLIGAAVMWLVALPAFGDPVGSYAERMRRVDGRVLLRVIGALLYGAALFAGLALALAAVDTLFELELEGEIYGHVWAWIFLVLVPWIVLGGLPDYVRPIERENEVAGVAHRIALYLVPPLVALYYVILYAYVVRIAVTGEMPKNLVSPLVLAAGGLAALSLVLFDPRPGGGGLARGLRLAPPLFLPLVPLGAWALIVRIGQYGWTEFRLVRLVVLAALAVLALGATLQLVRRRRFALHLAPLGVAAVLLLGAFGPWGILSVSRRSQQERLEAALGRVDVPLHDTTYAIAPGDYTDRPGAPAPADTIPRREVPAETYEQIRGSAQYLAGHFGPDALPPVVRRFAREEGSRWVDYAALLGLRPDAIPGQERLAVGGALPHNAPVVLEGGTAYRIEWIPPPRAPGAMGSPRPGVGRGGVRAVVQDSTRVVVHVGERLLYADLRPLLSALWARGGGPRSREDLPVEQAVIPLTDTAGVSGGQLVVWSIWAEADSTGTKVGRMEGLAVIR